MDKVDSGSWAVRRTATMIGPQDHELRESRGLRPPLGFGVPTTEEMTVQSDTTKINHAGRRTANAERLSNNCDGVRGDTLRARITWDGKDQAPSDGLWVRFVPRRARLYGFEFI